MQVKEQNVVNAAESESSTPNTTAALSHLAFCALVALALERQTGGATTLYAENLFLIRWLATAQKQKRFPRSVAIDIAWLLERGRKHGPAGKIRQHLEYLWHSCIGSMKNQSDLFRLTYASEYLKDQGWNNYVMNSQEWCSGNINDHPAGTNGFYVEKAALNAGYSAVGKQILPVDFRVIGNADTFVDVFSDHALAAKIIENSPRYHTIRLIPSMFDNKEVSCVDCQSDP